MNKRREGLESEWIGRSYYTFSKQSYEVGVPGPIPDELRTLTALQIRLNLNMAPTLRMNKLNQTNKKFLLIKFLMFIN